MDGCGSHRHGSVCTLPYIAMIINERIPSYSDGVLSEVITCTPAVAKTGFHDVPSAL